MAGTQITIDAWKRDKVPPVESDGILKLEDVSTLDLLETWLVTLSACDTAQGKAEPGMENKRAAGSHDMKKKAGRFLASLVDWVTS